MSVFRVGNKSSESRFPNIRPTLDLNFAATKTLDPRITFRRASGGSYFGPDGRLRYAGVNEPRFDHNPLTGECLGLLVEEQRTNLLLRSEEFDSASWGKQDCTVTSNAILAPGGSSTADLVVPNTNTVFHPVRQGVTVTSGVVYTYSVYAKAGGYNFLLLNTSAGSTSGSAGPIINLQTGAKAGFFTADYPTLIQSVGDGWYRISFQFTTSATATTVDLNQLPTASVGAFAGNGTSGVYLWGAQLEAGAFPTSYIPTTTTAVTRSADVASIGPGSNFSSWYRQDQGTVFVAGAAYGGAVAGLYEVSASGASAQSISVRLGQGFSFAQGLNRASFAYSANQQARHGFAFSAGNYGAALNGSNLTIINGQPSDTPASANQITLGSLNNSFILNGHIRRLTYFPRRLGNEVLQAITQ